VESGGCIQALQNTLDAAPPPRGVGVGIFVVCVIGGG
jgi:hypothetical protein